MSFDPVKYYLLASFIHSSEAMDESLSEARYRACVSRSYYAAFLTARDKASITSESGSVHRDVQGYYKNRNATLSNRLDDLRRMRGHADYKMGKTLTPRDSGKALKLAHKILVEFGAKLD